ncbi:MAG TPA: hypothetical protein VNW28_01930, partial [Chthoniobacterales bacterium]|nr:hypothetical protein [Chthoniobacterales bacterium]
MVADVKTDVAGDLEKLLEAVDRAAKEIRPFAALELRIAAAVKVDHLADIGVIESSKRDARNEIFIVYEAKGLAAEEVVVIAAKTKQTDAWLAESVDAV